MAGVTDDQVVALLPALEEAARATQRTVERFVPPRTGIVAQVAAARHQFVVGRRGVGKTTLLRKTQAHVIEDGGAVTFVDLETLRGIEYPDVLIRLLMSLFESLEDQLRTAAHGMGFRSGRSYRAQARKLRRAGRGFSRLLSEPQVFSRKVNRQRSQTLSLSGAGGAAWVLPHLGGWLSGRVRTKRTDSQDDEARAAFTQTKMDVLSAGATDIRNLLGRAMGLLAESEGLIVLDDFYHVRRADQPYVLAFMHQVLKDLNIYLKVGAVKHRLTAFIDGDPPVGMQQPHDASEVSLDVTLEAFPAAKLFLEKVVESIIAPLGVRLEELATDTARDRLILASGGVARDYLNVVIMALRSANDRPGAPQRPHNRITAEDVNEVASVLAEQKQQELALDAGQNAESLRERFQDLLNFCLEKRETNVFLVEATKLEQEAWGNEIQVLADLRFVHRIRNTTIQSSDYRGEQYVAFALDLSSYTATRAERITQIEFWEPGGAAQLRRANLIYEVSDDPIKSPDDRPRKVEQGKLIGL